MSPLVKQGLVGAGVGVASAVARAPAIQAVALVVGAIMGGWKGALVASGTAWVVGAVVGSMMPNRDGDGRPPGIGAWLDRRWAQVSGRMETR